MDNLVGRGCWGLGGGGWGGGGWSWTKTSPHHSAVLCISGFLFFLPFRWIIWWEGGVPIHSLVFQSRICPVLGCHLSLLLCWLQLYWAWCTLSTELSGSSKRDLCNFCCKVLLLLFWKPCWNYFQIIFYWEHGEMEKKLKYSNFKATAKYYSCF